MTLKRSMSVKNRFTYSLLVFRARYDDDVLHRSQFQCVFQINSTTFYSEIIARNEKSVNESRGENKETRQNFGRSDTTM